MTRLTFVFVLLLALLLPPCRADDPPTAGAGLYLDARGGQHPWRINETHVLQWDGTPYLPVGGTFMPHYWIDGATDAAWKADLQAWQTLQTQGVHDLCLYAGARGLTHVPPEAVQRVLDYLDGHAFRYGLEIADFPKDPLVGYVVKPSVYRDPAPPSSGVVQFRKIPNLVDALFVRASSPDAEIQDSGGAEIVGDDTALVRVRESSPGDVVLLYPERLFFPDAPEGHLPDLWQGYDEYRDRVLGFFRHIKLGPGFRFFLDPLMDRIGFNGEVENLVPTTDGFRLDFQTWLDKKYGHDVDELNRSWGVEQRNVPDFATAARCLPLWYQVKGVKAVYDPVKRVSYAVINTGHGVSRYWDDLRDFRIASVRGYMNAIADTLKHSVADVPVVYRWSQHSTLFTNSQSRGGFDGLGMEAYGHGWDLVAESAAYTYAQAEESARPLWLIVSSTQETERPADKTNTGYLSKAVLFDDWDTLKDIGARGFFSQALQRLPEKENAPINLASLPGQLAWLGSYAASLEASARTLSAEKPRVLWYPEGLDAVPDDVRQLPGGVWWLPSFRPGATFPVGPALRGYVLPDRVDGLPNYVLWSPHPPAVPVRFAFGKNANPLIYDAAGIPLKVLHKDDVWTVPIGTSPIQVRGVPVMPLPLDAADQMIQQVARLLRLADEQKIPTQAFRDRLFYITNQIPGRADTLSARYLLLQQLAGSLTAILRPYAWIEAENAAAYTFDSLVPDPAASGGAYLSLDTDRPPPPGDADGYHAGYKFSVNAPGRYSLWMAGSPTGTRDVSPFTWRLDDGQPNEAHDVTTEGGTYAGKFVWSKLGEVFLDRGPHTLAIAVTGRRAADNHYALSLDAFCLSRAAFHPEGPRQPPIEALLPPDRSGRAASSGSKSR